MSCKENSFVILSPGFAASESDTTCLPMQQEFVKTLSRLYPGLNIVILAFQYPYREKIYKWNNVTVMSFNGRNKGGISKLLLRRKLYAALKKIHREKPVTGLLSFWLNECALVGKRFGERNDILHYSWILGQDARTTNKYPKKLSVGEEELIALSDFIQDEFERNHGVRPFVVIPPGVEAKQGGDEKKDIDLLAVGSLIPLKRFEIFIELVSQLQHGLPDVKAVLVGAGPERKNLEALVNHYGMEKNISFAGEVSHQQVMQFMKRAKILVHPSSYEGFSGVCLEALSEGAHVVSFTRAMNREVEQWHIVNSAEELRRETTRLLTQPLSYKNVTPFLMSDTVQQVISLYDAHQIFSSEPNSATAFSKTNSGV